MAMSVSGQYGDRSLRLDDLASADPAMRECLEVARLAAPHDLEILIVGESGTGKNLLALAIHNESARRKGPFEILDGGRVAEDLIESEIFGHERGAFTGAHSERRGLFQLAHGGTLFLDEVGNMSPGLQRKLLTAVERRTFRRVGGSEELNVDLRLISATNADLAGDIDRGAFRRDLYHRLCRVVIRVPPLRERQADILPLARQSLAEANEKYGRKTEGFTAECDDRLRSYPWPGNVRQLCRAVSTAVALWPTPVIDWKELAPHLEPRLDGSAAGSPSAEAGVPSLEAPLDLVERWHIERVLRHTGSNITRAASILGVSRRGLYDKLRRHGLLPEGESTSGE